MYSVVCSPVVDAFDVSDVLFKWSVVAAFEVVFILVAPLVLSIAEDSDVDVTVVILIETSNVELFVES